MKILVVGNGAREHVIAESLKKSRHDPELVVYGNRVNPGMKELSVDYQVGDIMDLEAIKAFAERTKPDFAVIGQDDPIANGTADMLETIGIESMAPKKSLARLESSKSFTRDLLAKYNIPGNPDFRVFRQEDENVAEEIEKYILEDLEGEFVVKADGLCGGKGVKVVGDHLKDAIEGVSYAMECLLEDGFVIVEEKFIGQEFSLMSFADGKTVIDMPVIQDHKRAYEGDKGPNTGGMGTYNYAGNLPFLEDDDLEEAHNITVKVMEALEMECGEFFKGIMYGGFIATKKGVKLIEYNARFGDPEAMNALPLLETDFVDVCLAVINGTLSDLDVKFSNKATVCKYVVPEGYPENPVKGEKVEIGQIPEGCLMYYAAVDKKDDGIYMSTSRAIAFVGVADTIEEAEQTAQKGVEAVSGKVFYRKDIGTKELIDLRIEMMKEIRAA